MGKLKEYYTRWSEYCNPDEEITNQHLDDEYHYDKSKEVTMEEIQKNHDDWWNSLTEEEKQKIADEAQAATNYFDEQRANRDE